MIIAEFVTEIFCYMFSKKTQRISIPATDARLIIKLQLAGGQLSTDDKSMINPSLYVGLSRKKINFKDLSGKIWIPATKYSPWVILLLPLILVTVSAKY
jgi:hypothetical protein